MSDEKVLTKEIAEQFLADEDSVDLSEFTVMEDDAAESLSKCKSVDELSLTGLKSISDTAAENLGNIVEDNTYFFFELSNLESISEKAAISLCRGQHECDFGEIIPDGWSYGSGNKAPEEVPESLGQFKLAQILCSSECTDTPYLTGIGSNWSEDEDLTKYPGVLGHDLSIENAKRLAKHLRGENICLNGWHNVTDLNVLKILSEGEFETISLRLYEITVDVAKILSQFKCKGLAIEAQDLSEEAASNLAKFPGQFFIEPQTKSLFRSDAFKGDQFHKIFEEKFSSRLYDDDGFPILPERRKYEAGFTVKYIDYTEEIASVDEE